MERGRIRDQPSKDLTLLFTLRKRDLDLRESINCNNTYEDEC
jgi:hypothetical protein